MIRRLWHALFAVIFLGIVTFAGLALVFALAEFEPPAVEPIAVLPGVSGVPLPTTFTVLSWNIGYAGLDARTDFFMDGGTGSRGRSSRAVHRNLAHVQSVLRQRQADFVALQEVDRHAERSYFLDEAELLHTTLAGYYQSFVRNFDALWIPVPWSHPIGSVVSGLESFSRWRPISVTAIALYSKFPLPDRWFTLKRRALVSRYRLADHRLAVVNTHLSAFDKGGAIRRRQLAQLRQLMLALKAEGFLVLVVGDWNHQLPDVPLGPCRPDQDGRAWLQPLPNDFTPEGWRWAEVSSATVRTVGAPLGASTCYATIDGALLSPGLRLDGVERIANDPPFRYTDHTPVLIRFSFALSVSEGAG